jgi:hypothetical protein
MSTRVMRITAPIGAQLARDAVIDAARSTHHSVLLVVLEKCTD